MKGFKEKGKRISQADDLEDGLEIENDAAKEEPLVYQDGVLLNDEIFFKSSKKNKKNLTEEGLDEGEESHLESEEGSVEESEEDNSDSENDDGLDVSNDEELKSQNEINTDSLPFTFEAPCSLDQFVHLIDHRSADEISTIIQRIRVIYNQKLHVENKAKLQVYFLNFEMIDSFADFIRLH